MNHHFNNQKISRYNPLLDSDEEEIFDNNDVSIDNNVAMRFLTEARDTISIYKQEEINQQKQNDFQKLLEEKLSKKKDEEVICSDIGIVRIGLQWIGSSANEVITPVYNCELHPVLIIRNQEGNLFDDDDAVSGNPIGKQIQMLYRWSRSPERLVCVFHAHLPASMQCTITLKTYCSQACFLKGYQQLSNFYYNRASNTHYPSQHRENSTGMPSRPFNWNDPDSNRDIDFKHYTLLRQSGLMLTDLERENAWVPIFNKRNYTPNKDDIGHQLKFETLILSIQQISEDIFPKKKEIKKNLMNTLEEDSLKNSLQDNLWRRYTDDKHLYRKIITNCVIGQLPLAEARKTTSVAIKDKPGVEYDYYYNSNSFYYNNDTKYYADNAYYSYKPYTYHSTGQIVKFSVYTWNILADIYATLTAFPKCASYVLSWAYRSKRILHECVSSKADIICLQEVQSDHFEEFFRPLLASHGYEGMYKQKTKEIFTSGTGKKREAKYTIDGCATFYNTKKFTLVEDYSLEFNKLVKDVMKNTPFNKKPKKTSRLTKDNVALILLLVYNESEAGFFVDNESKIVIVANTHIVANPEVTDAKIWQAQILLRVIENYVFDMMNRLNRATQPAIILTGDFNSIPESAVTQLILTGKCNLDHDDFKKLKYNSLFERLTLGHSLQLKSAYAVCNAAKNGVTDFTNITEYENKITNYTEKFVGCLDYIFFTDNVIQVCSTLDMLNEEQLKSEVEAVFLPSHFLPSPLRPSDHISLYAEFRFKDIL